MKAVILQSGYIPWLGYFDLINKADIFVFLDDVQWTTRDWRNRNRIRTSQGWSWLTVPVKLERSYFDYKIKDVQIDNTQDWPQKHLGAFRSWYNKAIYFDEIYSLLQDILSKKQQFVVDLNYELIFAICQYIGISKTKFLFSQNMHIPKEVKKAERLLAIVEEIRGIHTYISGPSAKPYLEEGNFATKNIKVEWHDYLHPYYNQNTWGSNVFIPYLSIIDLLFNHGKESLEVITSSNKISKPVNIRVVPPEEYKDK